MDKVCLCCTALASKFIAHFCGYKAVEHELALDGSFDAFADFWCTDATQTWSVNYGPAPSVPPILFQGVFKVLGT